MGWVLRRVQLRRSQRRTLNPDAVNTGVGTVYDQAITDIVGGVETFVDGYGATGKAANDATTTSSAPVVTINGFHFGTGNTVAQPETPSSSVWRIGR